MVTLVGRDNLTGVRRTKKAKRLFLEAIWNGQTVTDACQYAGIDRTLPYKWARSDDEFAATWDDARETRLPRLKDSLFDAALAGHLTLGWRLLQRYEKLEDEDDAEEVREIQIILPGDGNEDAE